MDLLPRKIRAMEISTQRCSRQLTCIKVFVCDRQPHSYLRCGESRALRIAWLLPLPNGTRKPMDQILRKTIPFEEYSEATVGLSRNMALVTLLLSVCRLLDGKSKQLLLLHLRLP